MQRLCLGAAADAQSAETAFVAIMTWGFGTVGYGRWRTQRILIDTPNASARLAAAARTLAEDGASAAYERLASHKDCGLRGLGPAFGTKYIYFIQPRDQAVRALIFDRLVADWLGRETNLGLSAGAWSVAMYARYLDAMHAWASSLGCQPDDVETCIFRTMATERGNQWGRAHPPQAPRAPLPHRKGEFVVNDSVIGSRDSLDKLSLPSRPRPRTTASEKGDTGMWNDVRTGIYLRLIEAAIGGHTIAYSEVLPNAPRQVGPHLYPIADYEKAHRRPPLTALVVRAYWRQQAEPIEAA